MSAEDVGKGFYFDEKEFTSEWDAWQKQNIQDYSFTLKGRLPEEYWKNTNTKAIVLHEYEVRITVKDGVSSEFKYVGEAPHRVDSVTGTSTIFEPEYSSIADLYQKISENAEIQKEWWKTHPDPPYLVSTKFNVLYNETSHYITKFDPVSSWKPGVSADPTLSAVTISDFVVAK